MGSAERWRGNARLEEALMKEFSTRGFVYIAISVGGLLYQFVFAEKPQALPVFAMCALMGIGLYCLFGLGKWRP